MPSHPRTRAGPSHRERMLAGALYAAADPALGAARLRARALLARFNGTDPAAHGERLGLLSELLGSFGAGSVIEPTLRCDYGFNVFIGSDCFFNFDCVLLDGNRIEIGDAVQVGPGVHLYTSTHPMDAATRRSGLEQALPVRIGSGVWLGGRAIVCPGVTIGANTVVGAGSVVVHDLPADVFAAGNPCKAVRALAG